MERGEKGVKVVYRDGDQGTRACRGTRVKRDGDFVILFRYDGSRISFLKDQVIKIEEF